jgi:choline dehydrogenase-like flavoprotein
MQLDGRKFLAGTTLEADVCIVGGGPAGLTLARELCDGKRRIVLLEAGGASRIDSRDELALASSRSNLEPASDSRWRQLSGTAAIWNVSLRGRPGARYVPMQSIDFETREGLEHAGWPIRFSDLKPYYERAAKLAAYRGSAHEPEDSLESFELDSFTTTMETFGFSSVFTTDLPRLLALCPNATVVTNATVTGVAMSRQGESAEAVTFRTRTATHEVRASTFVLAAGGIENARLLLLTPAMADSNLIGRYFMDHPRVSLGTFTPSDSRLFEHSSAYDIRFVNGTYQGGKITPADTLMRSEGLLNSSLQLLPAFGGRAGDALNAARAVRRRGPRRLVSRANSAHARKLVSGAIPLATTGARLAAIQRRLKPALSNGGWSLLPDNRHRFDAFSIVLQSEQSPRYQNAVTLSDQRDRFGMPRARVESEWHADDLRSIRLTASLFAAAVELAKYGKFSPAELEPVPPLYQAGGAHHHMGTTRMSRHADDGVVDENLKLHSAENVFVTGSSVFPTGGYANPTLTILALTMRLADHIRDQRGES